jgi:hypothetical protein
MSVDAEQRQRSGVIQAVPSRWSRLAEIKMRQTENERLVSAFPAVGQKFEPTKSRAGKSRTRSRISIFITPIRNHPFAVPALPTRGPSLSLNRYHRHGGEKRRSTAAILDASRSAKAGWHFLSPRLQPRRPVWFNRAGSVVFHIEVVQ